MATRKNNPATVEPEVQPVVPVELPTFEGVDAPAPIESQATRPVLEILTINLPAMPDGKKRADVSADIEGQVLTVTFGDGRTIRLDAAQMDEAMKAIALMHGLKQKLVDAAAIPRDTVTGRSPSLLDKFTAVQEVAERITGPAPAWNKIRDGGVSSANELLIRALVEMSGKPREAVAAMVEASSKEELAALRKHPKVAVILLRMATENANANIDSNALLGKFMM